MRPPGTRARWEEGPLAPADVHLVADAGALTASSGRRNGTAGVRTRNRAAGLQWWVAGRHPKNRAVAPARGRHKRRRPAVVLGMSNITAVVARVFVEDLEAAIPLYQELAQVTAVDRFAFRDVRLARVGPFLLLSGNTAAYQDRVATLMVRRLAPVLTALERAGGHIVDGPSPAPNGDRLIACHPDGSVFEYIETGDTEPPA